VFMNLISHLDLNLLQSLAKICLQCTPQIGCLLHHSDALLSTLYCDPICSRTLRPHLFIFTGIDVKAGDEVLLDYGEVSRPHFPGPLIFLHVLYPLMWCKPMRSKCMSWMHSGLDCRLFVMMCARALVKTLRPVSSRCLLPIGT